MTDELREKASMAAHLWDASPLTQEWLRVGDEGMKTAGVAKWVAAEASAAMQMTSRVGRAAKMAFDAAQAALETEDKP